MKIINKLNCGNWDCYSKALPCNNNSNDNQNYDNNDNDNYDNNDNDKNNTNDK